MPGRRTRPLRTSDRRRKRASVAHEPGEDPTNDTPVDFTVDGDPDTADLGGDPVCWLHLLCPGCGAMLSSEDDPCPRCGREHPIPGHF